MGKFPRSSTRWYESIVHLTSTPVTLRLSNGTQRYHNLGGHTLIDFIFLNREESMNNTNGDEEIVFGRVDITYHLKYTITPVKCTYRFALNEIKCLRQLSSTRVYGRKDHLFAEVEFNVSQHAIDPGPRNRYDLGNYVSHDTGPIHTTHNLNFSAVTNFKILFYSKPNVRENILGTLVFTPLKEVFKHKIDDLGDSNGDSNNNKSLNNNKEGLLFITGGNSDSVVQEEVLLLEEGERTITKKIVLSLLDGSGSYEFVFSIGRENSLDAHRTDILKFISEKEHILGKLESSKKQKKPKAIDEDSLISNKKFRESYPGNDVQVLIDGLETFRRYYEVMMQAKHSIKILAWELSLNFGLIKSRDTTVLPSVAEQGQRWITLEDVLIDCALRGVKSRLVIWRHAVLSYINRYLYLGDVSIEHEVAKLERRCHKLGVSIKVVKSSSSNIEDTSYPSPDDPKHGDIVIVIVSSPKGLFLASNHEKLLLIDSECSEHCVAFVGGFDIAKGRYDQPAHQIPKPFIQLPQPKSLEPSLPRYGGREVQPFIRMIRFLWHDMQFLIRGPATSALSLHFLQRWVYSFTRNTPLTRSVTIPIPSTEVVCTKPPFQSPQKVFKGCSVRFVRIWKGVFDTNYLFNEFVQTINRAKNFLYIEHQYPFHNYPLTYFMCQKLKGLTVFDEKFNFTENKDLHVLIVLPVKTDLPTGIVGELVDWSQDHIISHLHTIKKTAPERVGIYGLVRQDDVTNRLKPIYIHTKTIIVDDEIMLSGSTNMDNMSFFYSSELSVLFDNVELVRDTRIRLIREHLGKFYKPEMELNFQAVFDTFHQVASMNDRSLNLGAPLLGRPVFMAPAEQYDTVLKRIYYPNKASKFLYKMGVNTEDLIQTATDWSERLSIWTEQLTKFAQNYKILSPLSSL